MEPPPDRPHQRLRRLLRRDRAHRGPRPRRAAVHQRPLPDRPVRDHRGGPVPALPRRAGGGHARAAPCRAGPRRRRLLQLRRQPLQRPAPLPRPQRRLGPGAVRALLPGLRAELGCRPAAAPRRRPRRLGAAQHRGHQQQQHPRPGGILPPLRDPAGRRWHRGQPVLPQHPLDDQQPRPTSDVVPAPDPGPHPEQDRDRRHRRGRLLARRGGPPLDDRPRPPGDAPDRVVRTRR